MIRTLLLSLGVLGSLTVSAEAERLVTIDGSITEIVYALDAEADLVGVDTTSTYPEAATELPDVGYMRALSAEGILSLAPDRVLTTADAGPADALSQLQSAGVDITIIDNTATLEGLKQKVLTTADAVGRSEAGRALADRIDTQVGEAQATLAEAVGDLNVMFVMDGGSRGFQVAGQGTLAHGALELAGFTNVFADIRGYKPLTPEAAIAANPEAILIFHSRKDIEELASDPALSLTRAAETGRIYNVDDLDLLTFGPRMGWSLHQLNTLLTDPS